MLVIEPKLKEVGSFTVRRSLPDRARRMVGPFIFFDHAGPTTLPAATDSDVLPHPHIGLATVTAVFRGALLHRDSLGSEQVIRPGDINWMTAGKGIAHSERTIDEQRGKDRDLHIIQLWAALPLEHEETAPTFRHYEKSTLPEVDAATVGAGHARIKLFAGDAFGATSPVETLSRLFYVELELEAGATLDLAAIGHEERALYVLDGNASLNGTPLRPATLNVLPDKNERAILAAASAVHAVALGGAPLEGHRHAWWNFVSSKKERIEEAKRLWRERGFAPIPGDTREFIPLPDDTR
jgi:redox-sensitive bicupin YhaK (pirin superfamily)